MGRVCKLSRTAIKNYISSLDGKVEEIFDGGMTRLRYSTDAVIREGREFITWANAAIDKGETETRAVMRVCEAKLSSAQSKKDNTPEKIKKEVETVKMVKTPEGKTVEKKTVEFKEERNPERDRLEMVCNELRGKLSSLYYALDTYGQYRRDVEYYEDNLDRYITEVEDVMTFLSDCRKEAEKHTDALKEQAEYALSRLDMAMSSTYLFPEMKENDGYADIDGVYSYCKQLGEELDAVEQKLASLQRTSDGLRGGWSDSVYEHFNGIVQERVPDSVSTVFYDLRSIKQELAEMCAKLEAYYGAPVYVSTKSVQLSYTYYSLEKGGSGNVGRYYDV